MMLFYKINLGVGKGGQPGKSVVAGHTRINCRLISLSTEIKVEKIDSY